ncbi:MAG: sulfate/molybdate ABC transporter ATP-binding protein [Lachnospirales bacterium]
MVIIDLKRKVNKFDIDLKFQSDSKRIGILGASGSGKSMILKMIAGIEKPDVGYISVDKDVFFDSKNKINIIPQKRITGYLFQNYALFPKMTVMENIKAAIKKPKGEKIEIANNLISKFKLTGLENQYPNTLSGGQKQRVAIARIMAYKPRVILLDEPFSALDLYLRDEMQRELLNMLKDYEGTVIIVSHNRDEIYRLSDELIILDNGKISVSGKTKDIFKNPVSKVSARLTGCKNIADANFKNNKIYVPLWDINFDSKDSNIKAVAIRAHQFNKDIGDYEFNVLDPVVTEDLFEYNISFKPSENSSKRLNWKVFKNDFISIPKKLYLSKEDLLHLYY